MHWGKPVITAGDNCILEALVDPGSGQKVIACQCFLDLKKEGQICENHHI